MEIYVDQESKLTLDGLKQHYVTLTEEQKNRKLFDLLDVLEFNQASKRKKKEETRKKKKKKKKKKMKKKKQERTKGNKAQSGLLSCFLLPLSLSSFFFSSFFFLSGW